MHSLFFLVHGLYISIVIFVLDGTENDLTNIR